MNRSIKKIAVLGSGVMGSRIACLFASVGLETLLLDIPFKPTEGTVDSKKTDKNKIVNDALLLAIKSKPSPVYTQNAAQLITTGNFEDDLHRLASCDWVIEVVIEQLDIKQKLFEQVEKHRTPGTLITSNTSGIPIHKITEGRSDDFKKHFCGTHFFNPPRYLKLLEIIPTDQTLPEVTDFLMHYGSVFLGKTTVLAKDTPAFIANRIGVFSILHIFKTAEACKLTVDEVDKLTGPAIGHPKSATYRTADVVGIDTLLKVANDLSTNCPHDEAKKTFEIPTWLLTMVQNKWLGDKTGQGFYKKTKTPQGKEIQTLNLQTLQYEAKKKVNLPLLDTIKTMEEGSNQLLQALVQGSSKEANFYRAFFYGLFAYVSNRIPEISNELYRIDDAMRAGFGWNKGPFEKWDAIGLKATAEAIKQAGIELAPWITEMLSAGNSSFYKIENGKRLYYDIASKSYKAIPALQNLLILETNQNKPVWQNTACKLMDIGDGIVSLEWKTKMNSMGGEVLQGILQSVTLAEQSFAGLVIANDGPNFSAGANVGLIFMLAVEQDYDEISAAVRMFQSATMRLRHSSIPVVVATHGLAIGGGCEVVLHADSVVASAESYIGLVEVGVGIIPAGGGTKEFALRAANEMHAEEPETITLKKRFFSIATAQVSTSAAEAFENGVLRKGTDTLLINSDFRIQQAKQQALRLYGNGYVQPPMRKDIKVLGKAGMGYLYSGIHNMQMANYASEYDAFIAKKLAYTICGGDLSEPSLVSEQYLLDLERETFLSLCGEKKTLQRLESVIKTGKPLRN